MVHVFSFGGKNTLGINDNQIPRGNPGCDHEPSSSNICRAGPKENYFRVFDQLGLANSKELQELLLPSLVDRHARQESSTFREESLRSQNILAMKYLRGV